MENNYETSNETSQPSAPPSPQQGTREAVAWNSGTPEIPVGTDKYFIVAVRRKSGKVWTFPATYCNDFGLENEYARHESGPGWSSREPTDSEDCPEYVTGWYAAESSNGDYDNVYRPLLEEGESVIGWQPIPTYSLPSAPTPAPQDGETK